MNIYEKLYWLTRLDYLQNIFIAMTIILGLWFLGHLIAKCMGSLEDENYYLIKSKFARIIVPICFWLSLTTACLIPTQKEAIFIIAGGKTINFIQSDTSLCKIPSQTTAIVSDFLNNQIKAINAATEKK